MNTLKSNISEAYKVQVDCLIDSESDSFDKNDMKEKDQMRKSWSRKYKHNDCCQQHDDAAVEFEFIQFL